MYRSRGGQYYHRVKGRFHSSLVAYWPLWGASGAVATDISADARNGVLTNLTPASSTSLNSKPCPLWDGTQGLVNLISQSAYVDNQEGTFSCFTKGIDYSTATGRKLFYYL